MWNFNDKLQNLLKTDPRFLDQEWNLIRNEIIDKAFKIDEKLIELLITDDEIKTKFFCEIKGHRVFNINTFVDFVQDKNFLNDSYTKYKNKIWLNIGGKFLRERNEVSLVRPYKDCILEWGQSKEDQKRKEIFFNEILAQDEIDRLLDPKVLTNFKKYSKDWEKKVEWFTRDENGTIKDNLIIKGNNLLALHSLKKEFAGKVKLIYIDPPYNTGNDGFKYNDNFNHSTWLTFMKNRFEVARELLRDDGVMFVQCDDNEQAYLKILMDEIFGRENFINSISIQSSTPSGLKTAHREKTIIKTKDSILVYKKDEEIKIKPQYQIVDEWDTHFNLFFNREENKVESLKEVLIREKIYDEEKNTSEYSLKNKIFEKFVYENQENIFQTGKSMPEQIRNKSLLPENKNKPIKYYSSEIEQYAYNGRRMSFLSNSINPVLLEGEIKNVISKLVCDFWNDIDFNNSQNEGSVSFPSGKKPEKLLYRIIDMFSSLDDIVLDYHLWSWTTCAVAHKMGRQYVWVEQMEYIETIAVERMKKVIDWEQGGISKSVNWQWWWELIYCELKKYNQDFIDQIQEAKDTEELLKIWENMKTKSFLNYNVELAKQEEAIEEFKQLSLDQQKRALVELLDKNQLYVNLSEINDKDFEVDEEDKRLNDLFYNR